MKAQAKNLLLVFAKFPQAGIVKTRLGKKIGYNHAAQLYEAFLKDLASRFNGQIGSLLYDIRWVFVPSSSSFIELISNLIDEAVLAKTSFAPYRESGLLQQQIEQFAWAYGKGYDNIVGIATDTPHLPNEYVFDAFDKLNTFDIVMGPTHDGGFYLLGSRSKILIQQNTEMSTRHVLRDLLASAENFQLKTFLLPPMLDVDDEDDLFELDRILSTKSIKTPCLKTQEALHKIFSSTKLGSKRNE